MGTSLYDEYLREQQQPVGPRRDAAPAPPPSLYDQFQREQAQPRPGVLRRTADAAVGLGKAAVSDPMGTAKMLGKGILDTAKDLGEMVVNPTAFKDWEEERTGRPYAGDGIDFKPSGATNIRALNAASLLLPAAGRAAGMGFKGIAAADIAAGAGLGAASTPDDPLVGALLGGGITGATYGGAGAKAIRGMGDVFDIDNVTKGVKNVVPPLVGVPEVRLARAPGTRPAAQATGDIKATLNKLIKGMPEDAFPGDTPLPTKGRGQRVPVSETVQSGMADDVLAQQIAEGRRTALRQRLGDDPITRSQAGYNADGAYIAGGGVEPLPRNAVPRQAFDVPIGDLLPEEALPAITKRGGIDPVPPNPNPAAASRRAFPEGFTTGVADDMRLQLDDAATAEKAVLPKLAAAKERAAKAAAEVEASVAARRAAAEASLAKAQANLERAPLLTRGANAGQKPPGLVRAVEMAQERLNAVEPTAGAVKAADEARLALEALEKQADAARQRSAGFRSQLEKMGGEAPAPVPDAPRPRPVASATPAQGAVRNAIGGDDVMPPAANLAASTPPALQNRPDAPRSTVSNAAQGVQQNVGTAVDATDVARQVTPSAVAPEPPPVSKPAIAEQIAGEARPELAPSKRGEVNWRTWLDQDAPGAQSVEARLQAAADPELVKRARGYESMEATYARSLAAAKELVDDNGLQTIDAKKVRALVERHGEAAIPALKKVAVDNEKVMADAAKVLNNPASSADDILRATQVLESAGRQTDELLGQIVTEQARAGRTLNALKIQAKLSSDPDLWLVHAKRALGDKPMTDEIMANVRRLAAEAATACGG
jgi:hypothetical protein